MNYKRRWCLLLGCVLAASCLCLLLLAADRRILLLALNTFKLCAGTCLISVPVGTGIALLLARTDLPLRRVIWLLLLTLLLLPLYMHAAAWSAAFGKLGWYSLARLSVDAPLLRGWGAAIWIHGFWSVPWVVLIVSTALRMSEPELEESALLEARGWRVFTAVTLRRATPGVVVSALWIALVTAGEMTVTDLYQIRTLAEELYTGFALSTGDDAAFGFGTALLFTGMLVGVALVALDTLVVAAEHVPTRAPFRFRLGRWRGALLGLVILLVVALVGVPLGSLMYQAGAGVSQINGEPVRAWSALELVRSQVPLPGSYEYAAVVQFSNAYVWTISIGLCSATLSLSLAVLLAWWGRRGQWSLLPAALVASLGLGLMGPLVGLSLAWLFSLSEVISLVWLRDRTILLPVLAATVRAVPLPILICVVAFRTLDRATDEAAVLDGAGGWGRMWHVGIRQRLGALAVAWLVALAFACGELSATIMVNPPGIETVPIRVFRLLHAGTRNQVASICLTSTLGFLLVALVVTWIGKKLLNDP